jgi:hypothetical protein
MLAASYPMRHDGKVPRDRHLGFAEPASLGRKKTSAGLPQKANY